MFAFVYLAAATALTSQEMDKLRKKQLRMAGKIETLFEVLFI